MYLYVESNDVLFNTECKATAYVDCSALGSTAVNCSSIISIFVKVVNKELSNLISILLNQKFTTMKCYIYQR